MRALSRHEFPRNKDARPADAGVCEMQRAAADVASICTVMSILHINICIAYDVC